MIDIYSDLIKQTSVFGTQMEMLEMCELKSYWEKHQRMIFQIK